MLNMKKSLSILGVGLLGASAISVFVTNTKNHTNNLTIKENIDTNYQTDWNFMYESVNSYLEDYSTNKLTTYSNISENDIQKVKELAKQNSIEMLERYKLENLNTLEIENAVKSENQDFAKQLKLETLKTQEKLTKAEQEEIITPKLAVSTYFNNSLQVDKTLKDLKTATIVLASVTAVASVAAAGFYAAAWWFRITLPWAIACTGIAAISGITSGVIKTLASLIDNNKSILSKAGTTSWNILLGAVKVKTLMLSIQKQIKITSYAIKSYKIAVTAKSWACIAVILLLPAVFALDFLLSQFSYGI